MVLTLPKVSRADLAFVGVLARWLGATGAFGRRTAALVGGPVRARAIASTLDDPDAARCELRIAGSSLELLGAGAGVRRIAQRVLGGPTEIAATRPLGAVEHAVWALVVAAALEDLGIAGEVWACEGPSSLGDDPRELAVELDAGGTPFTVAIRAPRSFAMRAPVPHVPAWAERVYVDAAIVVGRCRISTAAIRALAPRNIITIDPPAAPSQAELVVLGGALGLVVRPSGAGEVVADVVTGYVVRAMSLPDDARVELTVGLGTTQLSLRQVFELAVGQIVPLGRPLAGPFEIRAQGSLVGRGELVDVDGELGVRIVSLGEQE